MLAEIGSLYTALALAASLYGAYAAGRAARGGAQPWGASARRAVGAAAALLALAVLGLTALFLANRFEVAYVAQHSNRALPFWLKLSAVWAGQEGSLLVWSALQALLAALVARGSRTTSATTDLWALAILSATAAFFTGATLLLSNPFAVLDAAPPDGAGLNPLLRHPGMILHPPALYLGYVGLAAPYAFALAALLSGDLGTWTAAARRWTLGAWFFLGLGLLLGARWAYDVLGWGGYWGWDPVENAGLLPWFAATALLHGAAMQDQRRGFAGWNVALAALTFALVVFGTYATRSGVIQSVHAFGRSNLGGPYLGFMAVVVAAPIGAWLWQRGALRATARQAVAPGWREATFAFTLLLFLLLTASVFVGSILPTLTETLSGQRHEAGPEWFDGVTGPQFAALVLLMGVCPLVARAFRRSGQLRLRVAAGAAAGAALPALLLASGFTGALGLVSVGLAGFALGTTLMEILAVAAARSRATRAPYLNALWGLLGSNRRRYGGYLVHIGVLLMALGVIGTRMYPLEERVSLARSEPATVGGYTLVYEGLTQDLAPDHGVQRATLSVFRGGGLIARVQPELHLYSQRDQTIAVPAVLVGLREDLYVVLAGYDAGGATATVKVVLNRLVNLLWLGGLLLLSGGVVAAWPSGAPSEVPAVARRQRLGNAAALVFGVAVLAVASIGMWGTGHGASPAGAGRPQPGAEPPDFRLALLDGSVATLSELRGQAVVVNFWASWCPSCTTEMPDLEATWREYADRGVAFVGIAYNDREEDVRASVSRQAISYPVGLDGRGSPIATSYGITGVPETVVISPEGRVSYVHVGPISRERLRAELDRALAGGMQTGG